MSEARHEQLPFWTSGRAALAGVLLVLGIAAALTWVGIYEQRETLRNERSKGELLARVLEDHALRTVEAASIALTALADLVTAPGALGHVDSVSASLTGTLRSLPSVRSVAVLDLQGRVLASSAPGDIGLRLDVARLGALPPLGRDLIGPVVAGRGLADLSLAGPARPAPRGLSYFPLLRQVALSDGQALLLVALINPDAFASYQNVTLADEHRAALLASASGMVLASTGVPELDPGMLLQSHPVFFERMAAQDRDSYIGKGLRPGDQVVAYRASRRLPLVVVVEQPVAVVMTAWRDAMQWFVAPAGAGVLLVLLGTLAVMRSLRSREAARADLQRSQDMVALRERELSVLVTSVQEVIFRADVQGRLSFVNARWLDLTGVSLAQIQGRALSEFVLPEHRPLIDALWQGGDQSAPRAALAAVQAADGSEHWFEFSAVPLISGAKLESYAGSAVDVTARREAQLRLQSQLALTELLLEITPLPVAMLDMQGRFVSVNKAWEDFSGLPRAAVLGKAYADFINAEEAAEHGQSIQRLLDSGGPLSYATQQQHGDGSKRDVMITKVLIPDEHGVPRGVLALTIDVTEFRDAERATREAKEAAEESSRVKSEFIANISHELRTPLQSILGFSELGLMRGREHARLHSMFVEIHQSGQRMLALVNDLLDVSKIESTVGAVQRERLDLLPLLQEAGQELQPLLDNKQMRLALSLGQQPIVADVDPMRFSQLLRNVLANAIKFSPPGELVELAAEVSSAAGGGYGDEGAVHISVCDRGPGIPEAELESVFESFVQSSQTKDGSGGTGLGLAICRKIVQAHGGSIHASNREGGGCVFHIHLPLAAHALEAADA